jgi:hypothetical protein
MNAGHLSLSIVGTSISIVGTDGTVAATARESEFPGPTAKVKS